MGVKLLCSTCSDLLKLKGFSAVNEVGRKFCEGCGNNQDNLVVVDAIKCDKAIKKYNKKAV